MGQGAPAGNKFWEFRTKHGRDKLFETPTLLWEACLEYFEYQSSRELIEIDYVGKDATQVHKPHTPPFTKEGLCLYLGTCDAYLRSFKNNIKDKNDAISLEFSTILTRIDNTIFTQQYDGAATGFYNANIVKSKLGLTDKQDITSGGESLNISVNVQDKGLADRLNKE